MHRALKLVNHQLELQQIKLSVNLDPDHSTRDVRRGANSADRARPDGERHGSDAAGRSTLRYTENDEAGEQVRLRVRDTGSGIAADALPKIFEPFFSTKEDQHRTGLGLAIAKNIIDQHGGSIQVNSQPGAGAEFIVTLPALARADAGDAVCPTEVVT